MKQIEIDPVDLRRYFRQSSRRRFAPDCPPYNPMASYLKRRMGFTVPHVYANGDVEELGDNPPYRKLPEWATEFVRRAAEIGGLMTYREAGQLLDKVLAEFKIDTRVRREHGVYIYEGDRLQVAFYKSEGQQVLSCHVKGRRPLFVQFVDGKMKFLSPS